MNKYELLYIINPKLTDDEITKTRELMEKNFSEIENVDVWGLKKLAYKINDLAEGYYVLVTGTIDKKNLENIQYITKINKNFIRHLLINLDKDY